MHHKLKTVILIHKPTKLPLITITKHLQKNKIKSNPKYFLEARTLALMLMLKTTTISFKRITNAFKSIKGRNFQHKPNIATLMFITIKLHIKTIIMPTKTITKHEHLT